jgi:transcription antitermination factor NusG
MVLDMRFNCEQREWYAFRVRPRHEKMVSSSLRGKGYDEFLPLARSRRKWADRSKIVEMPLFPGYIFCGARRSDIGGIRSTPGIIDVIRAGAHPLPARREEVEGLRTAVDADLMMESCDFIEPPNGAQLRIVSGPLRGLQGLLVEVRGGQRLILSVELLRRSVVVELPATSVAFCAAEPESAQLRAIA